jgi:hypothetical protein
VQGERLFTPECTSALIQQRDDSNDRARRPQTDGHHEQATFTAGSEQRTRRPPGQALALLFSGDAEIWAIIGVSFAVSFKAILIALPIGFGLAFLLAYGRFPAVAFW